MNHSIIHISNNPEISKKIIFRISSEFDFIDLFFLDMFTLDRGRCWMIRTMQSTAIEIMGLVIIIDNDHIRVEGISAGRRKKNL